MFIAEQLVHHWKNISTARGLTKLLMPSHIFLRLSEHLILSGPLLQRTSKAKNIIPLEATFDVLSVDLPLVPFVVFLALDLQVLNALESHNLK